VARELFQKLSSSPAGVGDDRRVGEGDF
jgi:hypothetical protein